MYRYVNKKDISIIVGEISFTSYSGHASSVAVPALDLVSNGWDFDRYINGALNNSNNDVAGENKILITGTKNIYVSTTGDNGNSGDIDSPFRTIQYAMDYVAKYYSFGNVTDNKCDINVADGVYEESLSVPKFTDIYPNSVYNVVINGNAVSPQAVVLYSPSNSICSVSAIGIGCNIVLNNIYIDARRLVDYGTAITISEGAKIYLGGTWFLETWSGIYGISAHNGGELITEWGCTINLIGASRYILYTRLDGRATMCASTINLTNSSGSSFLASSIYGFISFYSANTVGTFTGKKYSFAAMSLLSLDSAEETIPGTIAGTLSSGSTLW